MKSGWSRSLEVKVSVNVDRLVLYVLLFLSAMLHF
jgi:hypothetical protein